MSYNEYRNEVMNLFKKSMPRLSNDEVQKYFNSKETDDIIRDDYDSFKNGKFHATSPSGTASALYMLY